MRRNGFQLQTEIIMKKGDIIYLDPPGAGQDWVSATECWVANGIGYASLHHYEDFEDIAGIFLEVLDEKFSLILFGDQKIACLSDTIKHL